jgi:phage baseplate assembly protein W
MAGINAETGKPLEGYDHVAQSLGKILTTHISERCMREWVGNPGLRIIGETANEDEILSWFGTLYAVISIFEPRLVINQFHLNEVSRGGTLDFTIDASYRPYAHLEFEQARLLILVEGGDVTVQEA